MHLTSLALLRTAAPLLLLLPLATEASANSGSVFETSDQAVTYEVTPQEIVTREVSPQWVAVKEISPQEVVRKKRPPDKEASAQQTAHAQASATAVADLSTFLDRLMLAESNGRDTAANPLSTALGAFQFIKSTFLDVARRHFPEKCAELTDEQVLALRTTRHFARSAAEAYTLENAEHLKSQGHEPTWPHLRLAFLLGPTGASRVLAAPQDAPLSQVLPASVIEANPFMASMTATDLVARAARDISTDKRAAGLPAKSETSDKTAVPPSIKIRCNQNLVSCQRWITLQKRKLKKQKTRNAEGTSGKGRKG